MDSLQNKMSKMTVEPSKREQRQAEARAHMAALPEAYIRKIHNIVREVQGDQCLLKIKCSEVSMMFDTFKDVRPHNERLNLRTRIHSLSVDANKLIVGAYEVLVDHQSMLEELHENIATAYQEATTVYKDYQDRLVKRLFEYPEYLAGREEVGAAEEPQGIDQEMADVEDTVILMDGMSLGN